MGRRFFNFTTSSVAVFVIAWAAVLSVPELRNLLPQQLDGVRDWDWSNSSTSTYFTPLSPLVPFLEAQPPTLPELAARYPDDVRVQLLAKEDEYGHQSQYAASGFDQPHASVRAYDEIMARHPHRAWLLANRLRFVMLSDPLQARTLRKGEKREYPYRELKRNEKAKLRDLAFSSIAVAQEGQRLEPDNAYFDWTLASCLFALDRDEEAMRILHGAARKPRYEEHIIEDKQARLAVQRMMREPIFEEKRSISVLDSGSAFFRQVARIAAKNGAVKERAGDHAKALQIYADLAALGARMRDADSVSLGTAWAGTMLQNLAWRRDRKVTLWERRQLRALGDNFLDAYARYYARTASNFALYAEAHGRSDLARQARRDGALNGRLLLQNELFGNNSPYNIPIALWKKIVTPRWICETLMSQLQTTIAVWLFLSLVLPGAHWTTHARAASRMSTHVAEEKTHGPTSIDVASVVLWIGCVMAALLMVMLRWGDEQNRFDYTGVQMLLPGRPQLPSNIVSGSLVLAPVLLCAIHVWLASIWRYRRRLRAARLLKVLMPVAPEEESLAKPLLRGRDIKRSVNSFISWMLPIAFIASWISVFNSDVLALQPFDYSLPIVTSIVALLWSFLKWNWSDAPVRPDVAGNLRWYRNSLGAIIALSSVAYAAFAFASLPARQEANARIDEYIQRGEMALIRETKPPVP